ncbi:MAG TPA: glycoside hydrolase family 2 TIM barrel-domain containing protein [Terriglobales bacterium]|nr:glycoside hydrolase family 2 TIM barrel-domain containing protein [Terriglobales bacterium]
MRQLTWLFLLLSAVLSAQPSPSPAPLIVNVEHRRANSLNGPWHYIVDAYDTGFFGYHGATRKDGFFRNAKPRTPADLVEYNFDDSPTLEVPGDWNSQKPELFFYEGTVWYEKTFTLHLNAGMRAFVYVGAANYFSRVYLNGELVCEHEGGFTPFNCEVTGRLKDGANFFVISVNNTRRRDGLPALNTDWWNYGGITRDVMLVEVPNIFIEDYFLALSRNMQEITGWLRLNGAGSGQTVKLRVPELKLEEILKSDSNGLAQIRIAVPKDIQLWSPENPKLYEVEFSNDAESLRDSIGFRTIETRGTDILLNRKPVFLRGISMHEEAPYRSGRAHGTKDSQVLLGWVQELRANFVRLAHYPHDEATTSLTDRLGILVWEEIPVYWNIDWNNPHTLAIARQQLQEMIQRDKNKASVILWSVGNETQLSEERLRFMRSLVGDARTMDSTRLITSALQPRSDVHLKVLDDPLGADLDVLGCNQYIGWYEGKPEDADATVWQSPYNKPLVMSEFGGDAKFGLHGKPDERWTEEYQENLYRHQLRMLDQIAFLRGMSPWILMDFRSPRRLLANIQGYYNRKGLISDHGEKKKAFYVLRSYYETKQQSH